MAKASSSKGAMVTDEANLELIFVSRVDKAIGKRYTAMREAYFNEAGHGRFQTYCVKRRLASKVGAIRDKLRSVEIKQNCSLIDFADDSTEFSSFPGLAGDIDVVDRKCTIFDFIEKCVHAQQLLSLFSKDDFELHVDEWFTPSDDVKEEVEVYTNQLKSDASKAFLKEMRNGANQAALKVMSVGRKWHYDYLLNLVDDFLRCEAESLKEKRQDKDTEPDAERDVSAWIENKRSKHFKSLQSRTRNTSQDAPHLLVQAAVTQFLAFCPRLSFADPKPNEKLNDSLEAIVEHITNAAAFVKRMAQKSSNCPFHFDLFVALDSSTESKDDDDGDDDDSDDDDSDDDSDDDDEPLDEFESMCSNNDLRHSVSRVGKGNDEVGKDDLFDDAYRKFAREAKFENARPSNKRFLGVVDRTHRLEEHKIQDEKLIMFEPLEENGRNIPKDAVPEFMMCHSPIVRDEETSLLVRNVMTSCGALAPDFLAVSFHITADGCIKAYLCKYMRIAPDAHRSLPRYMRVAPDDIIKILSIYFDCENIKKNKTFKTKPARRQPYIESLKESLTDPIFDAFRDAISD